MFTTNSTDTGKTGLTVNNYDNLVKQFIRNGIPVKADYSISELSGNGSRDNKAHDLATYILYCTGKLTHSLILGDTIQKELGYDNISRFFSTQKIKQQEGVEHLGKMLRGKIGYLHRFILAKLLIRRGKFTCYFKQVSDYSMILTGIQGSGKRVFIFFFHSFSTFLVKYICLICATVTIRHSTTLRYHTIIYTLYRCLNGSLL